jgi:hypothetical protein
MSVSPCNLAMLDASHSVSTVSGALLSSRARVCAKVAISANSFIPQPALLPRSPAFDVAESVR